jgi:hypothetical protein
MARPVRISASVLRDRSVVRSVFSAAIVLALVLVGVIGFLCTVGPQSIGFRSDHFTGLRVSDNRAVDHSKPVRGAPTLRE